MAYRTVFSRSRLIRLTKQRRAERRKVNQRRWVEKHDDESIGRVIAEREYEGWSDAAGYDARPAFPPPTPNPIPAHLRIPDGMNLEEWMESIMSISGEDGWKWVWSERQRWLAAAA